MPALRLRLAGTFFLAFVLASGIAAATFAAGSPSTATIAKLNDTLLAVLKNAETLGFKGRLEKLTPAVDQAFDLDFMAEKSVGKYWKPLSDADKARWRALFQEYTAATYAGNFDHYANQRFEISGEEPSQNDTTVVHTMLIDPGGENTALDYRLHQTPKGPKVIDIYLKGTVSQLALQRSDFTSVLERGGLDALTTTIRGKVDDLAAGRAKRQRG
jgi:phospholipid transport system substrate-binding protein